MKVVLDTNVIISALFWEGKPADVMRRVEAGEVEMCLSAEILEEVEWVLVRDKLKVPLKRSGQRVEKIVNKVYSMAHIVNPRVKVNRIKTDPEDNKFLECALECKADYIVSGDRHLLDLGEFSGIKIVTATEFLESLW